MPHSNCLQKISPSSPRRAGMIKLDHDGHDPLPDHESIDSGDDRDVETPRRYHHQHPHQASHINKINRSSHGQHRCYRHGIIWTVSCAALAVAIVLLFVVDRTVNGGVFTGMRESSLEATNNREDGTSSYRCFQSKRELAMAVDEFLEDPRMELSSRLYGPVISGWCVDFVDDFSYLFSSVRNPKMVHFDADISLWNTASANNFSGMFYGAQNYRGGDLSGWNTSNVIDMSQMFFQAFHFEANVTGWDTSAVQTMRNMFRQAYNFTGIGVDTWDVSSVTDMAHLFHDAWLFDGDVSLWDTSMVADISNMFREAKSFAGDLSQWNVEQCQDMSELFRDAFVFHGDLSRWNVSAVTDMHWMFSGAYEFDSNLSAWDTSRVQDMSYMFFRAFSFRDGGIGTWDVSSVRNMAGTFRDSPFQGDISSWDVSQVWNFVETFRGATLFNGTLTDWNVSAATTMRLMFRDATSFDGDLSTWDTSNVMDTHGMFWGATSFTGYQLQFWDISRVNEMALMFTNATHFEENLCPWLNQTQHYAPNMTNMLLGTKCPHLREPLLSGMLSEESEDDGVLGELVEDEIGVIEKGEDDENITSNTSTTTMTTMSSHPTAEVALTTTNVAFCQVCRGSNSSRG